MDLSIPGSDFQPTITTSLTPVFGDNVQDLLNVGALHVNPSSIFTVNSIADVVDDFDGVTTLREAIDWANADALEDLIVFERSVFSNEQTISLNLGQLDITYNLSIIAPRDELTGGNLLTVSGNRASRVFEIATGATVSIDGAIVADGNVTGDDGGGIKNSGTLTLDNSIIRNNLALGNNFEPSFQPIILSGYGGGIYNNGTLTVNNSTISANRAGTSNNFIGGGVITTEIEFDNNSALSSLIGILTDSSSSLTLDIGAIVTGGIGGGIYNAGTVTVNNSTISDNGVSNPAGGAIGGGIYNTGTATVNNSTISANKAYYGFYQIGGYGGGIYNKGTLSLVFSTLTLNQANIGGGVYNNNRSDTVNVRNTIIAQNSEITIFSRRISVVRSDLFGNFTSDGYNLIGDSTRSTGFGVTGDIVGTRDNPIDPLLAPLDFYGGTTQTIALLPDSPAIDAGDPTVLDTDPTTDGRGFPRVSNGRADIGAFEAQV